MRHIVLAMFAGVPAVFGIAALILGHDANWDLRNYHWYNAYAFLNGRLDFDMGAAQTPTFYNPTLDIPFFLAAKSLPAGVFSFLLGALQGCNFILLYILTALVLRLENERARVVTAGIIALAGVIGGGHLALVGTVFFDNITSLFVLASLVVILRAGSYLQQGPLPPALRRVALAGLLVGLGVGLKLPTQIFAVGICFGLLFLPGPFLRRFMLSFVCGLGVIAGFAIFGGWWMWELWTHFANPLFPYFNDVVRSPWALPESYRDTGFVPETVWQALVAPFRIFLNGRAGSEIAFRDARLLSAYVILFLTPIAILMGRTGTPGRAKAPYVDVFAARYLAAFAALSYVVWLKLFGIYRYMIPLEMVAPLIVVVCLAYWPIPRRLQAGLAASILGAMIVTTQVGDWGRKPWAPGLGGKFVDVAVPEIANPGETLVLMFGFAPTAFVIPAFPPQIPFLRPQSYLLDPAHPTRFNEVMRARITGHLGDIFVLQAAWERSAAERALPDLGLALEPNGCKPVRNNLDDQIELCALRRIAALQPSDL